MTTGNIQESGIATLNRSQVLKGVQHFANKIAFSGVTTQTLVATDAILASETNVIPVAGSGGAVTLTSTPTIANGDPWQVILIVGTDNTNTVTIQDNSAIASNVDLGGANVTLGNTDYLALIFNDLNTEWERLFSTNN